MLRAIVKYFLIFLAFHFVLIFAFKFYMKRFSVSGHTKKIIETPASADFLIMGNSHAIRAIDTAQLQNTILLAEFGDCPEGMYYKLKKIIREKKITFKYLVLPFDFATYSPLSADLKNYKTPLYYSQIDHMDYLPDRITAYNKLKSKYLYWLFPYKEFGSELEKKREASRKYKKSYQFISETKKQKIENFFFNGLKCGEEPNRENTLQLRFQRKLIELCLRNNIKLIALSYPMHSSFNKVMKDKSDNYFVKEHTALIRLLENYRIPYLDHSIFMDKYSDQIFSDYQHLNYVGQYFFSPLLLHQLDSISKISKKDKPPAQEVLQ